MIHKQIRVSVARLLLVFAGLIIWAGPSLAFTANISGSPTPNAGDYTVSWDNPTTLTYYLEELPTGGGWTTITATTGSSYAFTGKAPDDYMYRLRYRKRTCTGWPEPTCTTTTTYSETTSVSVVVDDGIAPPPSEETASAAGGILYGVDVDTNGDAIIRLPVDVIPGIAGFGPSLSLDYDSGRGVDRIERSLPEDTLGYGWRLAGLSEIRRCVVNQSSGSSINLTNSDSLCLDGMPLVLASGTHLAVGATYRTQIESYANIDVKGASGTLWFEVTSPDGTKREYGNGSGSRVDKNGGTDYQWSVNRATSTDGNVIDFAYFHDVSNGINYILDISYADAEVRFEYMSRTDAAAVSIGSASQTQSGFLHTIRVKYDDKKVREYRLLDEVVSGRRRLNKVQHCGFDEAGTGMSCLASLDVDWMTPTSTMAGVDILVDSMTDSLNAVHQIEYGTITGTSHPFLFTERPFGNGSLPANTQLLSGSGALRHVATKLRRDNGLGGFHDTTYAYQNKGIKSTNHWGFLGFYAQRIKDEQSGIVTYLQYRVDYPHFGQVARLHQFDGVYPTHTQTLTRSESDYAQQSISHTAGTSVLSYVGNKIDFIHEGASQLGASKTTNALTFSGGIVSQAVSTTEIGTNVSTGSSGGTWGDIPSYTVSGLKNTTESDVSFTNRTSSGDWLINFPNSVTSESWPGAASGNGIVRDATLAPQAGSLRPASITQFPNHSSLTLSTVLAYDSSGRAQSATVSGDNVSSRVTSISSFIYDRYPGPVTNPKGHTTSMSSYDPRFGTVKVSAGPNGTNSSVARDPFGRITSTTNTDGVTATTSYINCPTGCGLLVYGISPSYYVQVDSVVTPISRSYFDSLNRVIYTETESFSGATYSKQNIKYDTQGRVEKSSLPYLSGTPKDLIPTYDIRNRVTNVSRPDGSSTGTVYGVSGSNIVVTTTDIVKKANGASAGSQVKQDEYNILGQLVKTTDGFGTSTNPSITYTHDALGNALTVVVNGGSAGSTTTTMEYDEAGNQTEIIGPDVGTITSTYTALNEVKTRIDNKSQLFTYSFDVLGRLTSLVSPDGTSSWVWDTASNGKGKLASRSNTGFTESYSYDSSSRIDSVVTGLTPIGGTGTTNYTTSHTYDSYGRPLNTTYPGGFVLTRAYNARGYLSQLKNGATAIQTINNLDAFGNSVDESYANGVNTLRTFDPETGRLTDVNTTNGSTVFQNNDYAWRSNGTLENRIANPAYGLSATRKETYTYDVLNRVTLAETFINGSNTRDLSNVYNQLGNITSKTSTLTGDTDVTGYVYGAGAAGPHAVTSAAINGISHTLTYDLNGAVTKYDIAGTSDDKYIDYNAHNLPTKIVIGSSLTDSTPVAKDEFAYDPNGQRYSRKTTWQEGGSTPYEVAYYIGPVEIIFDNSVTNIQLVTKTTLSPNVIHVEMVGTVTDSFFEYAHRDHLGSIEVVTDENGNKLDNLAFEPFGSRKKKDWTANISSTEFNELLELDWDHSRKARGFTGHEHLDRTGFIHMNGRVYDPVLGRFLSPDPFVPSPTSSQSWNRYSYVRNSPLSATDPSGFIDEITVKGKSFTVSSDPFGVGGLNTRLVSYAMGGAAYGERTGGRNGDDSDDDVPDIFDPNFTCTPPACLQVNIGFPLGDGKGSGDGQGGDGRNGSQHGGASGVFVGPSYGISSSGSQSAPSGVTGRMVFENALVAANLTVGLVPIFNKASMGSVNIRKLGTSRAFNLQRGLNSLARPLLRSAPYLAFFDFGYTVFQAQQSGDYGRVAVSGVGAIAGVAIGAAVGVPAAVGFAVFYAAADLTGLFDGVSIRLYR